MSVLRTYPEPAGPPREHPAKVRVLLAVQRPAPTAPTGRTAVDAAAVVAWRLQTLAPHVDGSVQPQIGFGQWDVEPGVVIESTTVHVDELLDAVCTVLGEECQTCAYVEIDGEAIELNADGGRRPIEGHRG